MKKINILRLVLIISMLIPFSLVLAVDTKLVVNHSDYFKKIVMTPESIDVSISGLPENDKILLDLGERRLISNTPACIEKIDNDTFKLTTELVYEVSSNIYTFYTYKDAYPNGYEKTDNQIEWLYLRTCDDFGLESPTFPVTRNHYYVSYNSIELGELTPNLGFQGWLDFDFHLQDQQPPNMVFNDLNIAINTSRFYSVLTSAVISESEMVKIGTYQEFYNSGSEGKLGAILVGEKAPISEKSFENQVNIPQEVANLNLGLSAGADLTPITPYDCQQVRLPFTIGKDLVLGNMKSYISIQPDVKINQQYITGRVIRNPNKLNIDTRTGIWGSNPAMVLPGYNIEQINVPRVVSAYVQNYNFKNTYKLKFLVYSTMDVLSTNGSVIDLGIPLLNIGDRYIDLTLKGTVGADVGINDEITDPFEVLDGFFTNLFSSIEGIALFAVGVIVMFVGVYALIKFLPVILRGIGNKSKEEKKEPKPEPKPQQNKRSGISRKY